jgi:hypothetical protein
VTTVSEGKLTRYLFEGKYFVMCQSIPHNDVQIISHVMHNIKSTTVSVGNGIYHLDSQINEKMKHNNRNK